MTSGFRLSALLLLGMAYADPAAASTRLDDQRAIFTNAYTAAERGQWVVSAREQHLIEDYVLWPDLRGKYLEKNLQRSSASDIRQFLDAYPDSSAARALRYRWAKHLYRRKHWGEFLEIYTGHYAQLKQAELDCMAISAQIRSNRTVNGPLALTLWQVGKSQPKECDAVFKWLADNGLLDKEQIGKRYALALARKDFGLAQYLARDLGEEQRAMTVTWKAMRRNPRRELIRYASMPDSQAQRSLVAYGIERLAREDTAYADVIWKDVRRHFDFNPQHAAQVSEAIALVAAWRHRPAALRLILSVPAEYRSDELLAWQVRSALRVGAWTQVQAAIALMSEAEAGRDQWRYWRGRALIETGSETSGHEVLREVGTERSFYGFLAADIENLDYEFGHEPLTPDSAEIARLGQTEKAIRARELFLTGLTSRARSEWDSLVKGLSDADKAQAALLAQRWEWHSRAISTAASGGYYDDLALRYPLPWQDWFESYSGDAKIDAAWAYGIARSESLFMRDVRSSAGAVGLMQLMPATGRQTARNHKMPYHGLSTLTDPRSNISLGTRYLGSMYKRFGRSQVLATAAYNAGPHRVDRWLPKDASVPADIWIESIPYDETRKYVQRVLEANTVFHWRMTRNIRRVSQVLGPIAGPLRQAAIDNTGTATGG